MRRLSWVVVTVLALALAAAWGFPAPAGAAQDASQGAVSAPTQIAQMTRGGARGGQMSEADRAKMRQQMLERMLEQAGLSAKERTAARNALKAKDQARRALQAELTKLRRTANKERPTSKELRDALAAYRRAVAQYRKKIEAQDVALMKQLSLKGQIRCTSLGILDNGLGLMGMARGMPRPGLSGARRPRQPQ